MKLQFRIQHLVFFTVMVATLVTWWSDRERLQRRYEQSVERQVQHLAQKHRQEMAKLAEETRVETERTRAMYNTMYNSEVQRLHEQFRTFVKLKMTNQRTSSPGNQ